MNNYKNRYSHALFLNFENEWKVKNGFVLVLLKDKNGICQVNIFCSSTNSLDILLYSLVYLQNASPCIDYSALESNNCHTNSIKNAVQMFAVDKTNKASVVLTC